MREIKFRAVTLEGKIIENVGKIEFFEDGSIISNDEIPIRKLIQYTGLKDKNGKEIYEGDVVYHNHKYGDWTQTIEWGEHEDSEGCGIFGYYLSECVSTDGEIIGNIYKNPELVEK